MRAWMLLVLLASVSCASMSDAEAVKMLNADFAAAMNTADVDTIMSLTTPDVVMMPPGAPPVRGTDAVRATFETMFEQVVLEETWTSEEIVVRGDLAYDWSRYVVTITPRDAGGTSQTVEEGQNFFVARRQPDGSWRYSRMMWNRDRPSGS